jgi:hypothetical protein
MRPASPTMPTLPVPPPSLSPSKDSHGIDGSTRRTLVNDFAADACLTSHAPCLQPTNPLLAHLKSKHNGPEEPASAKEESAKEESGIDVPTARGMSRIVGVSAEGRRRKGPVPTNAEAHLFVHDSDELQGSTAAAEHGARGGVDPDAGSKVGGEAQAGKAGAGKDGEQGWEKGEHERSPVYSDAGESEAADARNWDDSMMEIGGGDEKGEAVQRGGNSSVARRRFRVPPPPIAGSPHTVHSSKSRNMTCACTEHCDHAFIVSLPCAALILCFCAKEADRTNTEACHRSAERPLGKLCGGCRIPKRRLSSMCRLFRLGRNATLTAIVDAGYKIFVRRWNQKSAKRIASSCAVPLVS